MANRKNQSGSDQDMVFAGWQETSEGTHLVLFTILLFVSRPCVNFNLMFPGFRFVKMN